MFSQKLVQAHSAHVEMAHVMRKKKRPAAEERSKQAQPVITRKTRLTVKAVYYDPYCIFLFCSDLYWP